MFEELEFLHIFWSFAELWEILQMNSAADLMINMEQSWY